MTEEQPVRRSRVIYEDGQFVLLQESNIKGIVASYPLTWANVCKFFNDQFEKEGRYLPPPPNQRD